MKKPGKSSRQTAGLKTPRYSLLAGKIQGIVAGEGTRGPANAPNTAAISAQYSENSLRVPNKEFFAVLQGIRSVHEGISY